MRFRGHELSEMTDAELDEAENVALDGILRAQEHYTIMRDAYALISQEQANRQRPN